MNGYRCVVMGLLVALLFLPAAPAGSESTEASIVESAADVVLQVGAIPEKGIPPRLLRDAHGVAVFPGLIKVGLVVGGRYGKGVVVVRDKEGGWSDPVFATLTGGSVGWQIGAESTDVVLVFKTGRSVEGIAKGKFTLGADVSAAAGPVGRRIEAATDADLKAEIFSYSRSRGLFAGVSVEGAALQIDDASNEGYYGRKGITSREVFAGSGITPHQATKKLKESLSKLAGPAAE